MSTPSVEPYDVRPEQLQSAEPFPLAIVKPSGDEFADMTDRELLEYIARHAITPDSLAALVGAAVPAVMSQLPTIIDALEHWEGELPLTIRVAMRALPAFLANMGKKE